MQNYYRFIVPRLNGASIKDDYGRCLSLVRKGIAGFIIFGGELGEIRKYVGRLQEEAPLPLIIASDLERGLGQQVKGGTHFPPAMAVANVLGQAGGAAEGGRGGLPLIREGFAAVAVEAAYAGINTIFAPVLDINTNRRNPIIAARAFGEDEETVSFLGCEMIKALQGRGIAACGKHFPGHGDTEIDSHIKLPSVRRELSSLKVHELKPFEKAIEAGVKMIMLGHLSVPSIDPSGTPVSLSGKAVAYLRKKMKYDGILITDAMNMGGIGKYPEEEASLMALEAGVDIILHPSDPEKIVSHLERKGVRGAEERLSFFRNGLLSRPGGLPDFGAHRRLAKELTGRGIKSSGDFEIGARPLLIILNDEDERRGEVFIRRMREKVPGIRVLVLKRGSELPTEEVSASDFVMAAIFSETKAWKGGASNWLRDTLGGLDEKTDLFISFGSPYLLDPATRGAKVFAYWDSEQAQEAVAGFIREKSVPGFPLRSDTKPG